MSLRFLLRLWMKARATVDARFTLTKEEGRQFNFWERGGERKKKRRVKLKTFPKIWGRCSRSSFSDDGLYKICTDSLALITFIKPNTDVFLVFSCIILILHICLFPPFFFFETVSFCFCCTQTSNLRRRRLMGFTSYRFHFVVRFSVYYAAGRHW